MQAAKIPVMVATATRQGDEWVLRDIFDMSVDQ
jgi:hypothetical protein